MNKNFSIQLNVVLLIAVAVLYYLHFSSPVSADTAIVSSDSAALAKPIVKAPKDIKASKIVFVNTDVLNEQYELVKELTANIKSQQQSLDAKYQRKGSEFQQKYMDFQQKANQGLLSENETIKAQEELAKGKDELDKMEAQLQGLMDKMQADNEIVLKNVMDYIDEYNKNSNYNYILAYSRSTMSPVLLANDSLDITSEIVDGLNEQYRAKKGIKK
jgi:outer membrane protein